MNDQKITSLHTPSAKPARVRRTRAEWEALLSEWEQSGQSQKAFCESRKVCYRNFNQWKSRIKNSQSDDQTSPASFIPIQVKEDHSPNQHRTSAITIDLPNKIRLTVNNDVTAIMTLIKSLSESLC